MPSYDVTLPDGKSYAIHSMTPLDGAGIEAQAKYLQQQGTAPAAQAPASPTGAPYPAPDAISGGITNAFRSANSWLGRQNAAYQQGAERMGIPSMGASLLNPVPSSVPGLGIAAATQALPFLKLAGGPLRQFLKSTGLGTAAGGLAGAVDPNASAVEGAMGGALGGSVAGIGKGLTAKGQQNTLRAMESLQQLRREPTASPLVRSMLPDQPTGLFEHDLPRRSQSAASKLLDDLVDMIHQRVPNKFPLTNVQVPPAVPSAPDRLSSVRGVQYAAMPGAPVGSPVFPVVDVREGQRLVAALRSLGENELARKAEIDLVTQLSQANPGLGAQYQRGIGQYAADQKFINVLRTLQEATAIPGGGSAIEAPHLAEAAKQLGLMGTKQPGAAQLATNALLAAHNPGSFYGAGHVAGLLRDLAKKGLIDPTRVNDRLPVKRFLWEGPAARGGALLGDSATASESQ